MARRVELKAESLTYLRCVACGGDFALEQGKSNQLEVWSGRVRCRSCSVERQVNDGIVDLLYDPPDFVVKEAEGLDRFANLMRSDGWDKERVLSLPDVPLGYWFGQKVEMESLLDSVEFKAGETLIDIGSNTCWASAIFAEKGLDVFALDITRTLMQGLDTAEWWFQDRGVFFERILGTMYDLPFKSNSVDWVFCCEVLHHNDRNHLQKTMNEIYRVLQPGGKLLVINEPMRFLTEWKLDHGQEVAEFEGNENVYFFWQYLRAAKKAGFSVEVREPRAVRFFRLRSDTPVDESMGFLSRVRCRVANMLRKRHWTRRFYLYVRSIFGREISLSMVCVKPESSPR